MEYNVPIQSVKPFSEGNANGASFTRSDLLKFMERHASQNYNQLEV